MTDYIDSDLCPYLEMRAKQKRICDRCFKGSITIKPSLNPNAGYIVCSNCDRMTTTLAPEYAQVPWDGKTPWRNPKKAQPPMFRVIKGRKK